MGDALRVVAYLSSPLAGDPPHLDSLLVYVASRLGGKDCEPGYKVDRKFPCPDDSKVAIPLLRNRVQGFGVALASSPIMEEPSGEWVEYIAKRIGVEHAGMLAPHERKVVATTNGWAKSHRLPLRVRRVGRVAWLAVGDRREILKALKQLPAIGRKISDGYGRVSKWECERLGDAPHWHWPWWVESEAGPVLMRPLPRAWEGLPANLIGAAADHGACTSPYWHRDRYGEVVVPC